MNRKRSLLARESRANINQPTYFALRVHVASDTQPPRDLVQRETLRNKVNVRVSHVSAVGRLRSICILRNFRRAERAK